MKNNSEQGFSYIDVMCAIVILMVGILALLSAITASVIQSSTQQQQLQARQLAASTMESIMSAKETTATQLGWISIGNVGSNPDATNIPRGIFLAGAQPVLADAGLDRIVGTADDTGAALQGYRRQIVVTDVCDPERPSPICPVPGTFGIRIRSVQVTVTFPVGNLQRQEQILTLLTDYSITN